MTQAIQHLVPSSSQAPMFPAAEELKTLKEMAQTFISSGLIPKSIDRPEKAIVIMLKGREAGIPPLQALSHIYVIDGKPAMSAELMLSQLYKNIPGFASVFTRDDQTGCVLKVKRPGGDWQEFSFTMEDAKQAGLLNKQVWRNYPRAMMRARCISSMARAVGPDALAGISHTPEELGAEMSPDGEVVGERVASGDKANRIASMVREEKPAEVVVQAEVVEHTPQRAPTASEMTDDWQAKQDAAQAELAKIQERIKAKAAATIDEPTFADFDQAGPIATEPDDGDMPCPLKDPKVHGVALKNLPKFAIPKMISWIETECPKPVPTPYLDFAAAAKRFLG